ncbi:CU044_5270 family protein [Spirillospora sp. NPDC047279]|uniref:CU044_5270 family protein n=1 Tax=Spirillospora sp. NPDC047279 TaxID=3155478 RepID=UPI0033F9010C
MTTDEITTFRDARPEAGPYDPDAKARARARLLDGEAAPRRRPFRFPRLTSAQGLLAVGAATAVLVAGPTLAIKNLGGDGKPAPGKVLAQKKADDRPRPGQWAYLKTVTASSSKGVGGSLFGPPDRRVTSERWRSVDGKQVASLRKGRLSVTPETVQPGMSPRSDYPYLLSLPTDSAALRAEIEKTVDAEYGPNKATPAERAARAFEIIEIYLRDAALPSRLRHAFYSVLQNLPGVKYEAKAVDILDRPGVTFYRVNEGYLRSEIMIDPSTYQYLGFRAIAIKTHVSQGDDRDLRSKKGQILGWGGLAQATLVDHPGQRPS